MADGKVKLKHLNQSGATEGQTPRWRNADDEWVPEDLPDLPNEALFLGPWGPSDELANFPVLVDAGGYTQGAFRFPSGVDREIQSLAQVVPPTKGTAAATLKALIKLSVADATALSFGVEANIHGAGLYSAITGSPFSVVPAASTAFQVVDIGAIALTKRQALSINLKRRGSVDSNTADVDVIAVWPDYSQEGAVDDHISSLLSLVGERTTDQSIPTGSSFTTITGLTSVWDTSSGRFTLGTDRITANVACRVMVGVSLLWASNGTGSFRQTRVRRFDSLDVAQDSNIAASYFDPNGIGNARPVMEIDIVQMAVGDYLSLEVRQNGSGSVNMTVGRFYVALVELL